MRTHFFSGLDVNVIVSAMLFEYQAVTGFLRGAEWLQVVKQVVNFEVVRFVLVLVGSVGSEPQQLKLTEEVV